MTVRPPNLSPLASAVISALGRTNRRALSVPFTDSIYPEARVLGAAYASTDIYSYNAQRVNLDHLGNAYPLPKHYLAPEGISYFQNEFAADGVDWTDVSNWTVDASVTLTYEGDGWMRVQNASAGSAAVAFIEISIADIEGRSFSGLLDAYNADETNSGFKFGINRVTGGASILTTLDTTLTSATQSFTSGVMTGLSGQSNVRFQVNADSTATVSDDFYFRFPGIIEWRTGQDTSKPPMPEDIKCFVPVGPEIWTNPPDTVGSGWTDNGDSTYTHDGTNTQMNMSSVLVVGKRYTVSYTVDSTSAGTLQIPAGTNATSTVGAHTVSFTATVANFNLGGSTFVGTISGISIRESANGFYASEYTPANTVSSGVITRGTGTLLHPWHWERIGYSVPLKVKDQYDPWEASTAYGAGHRVISTDRNGWYFISSGGTSDGSEPDWSTVTAPGDTVTDNDITWTAGYYANLGVPIEPATTQDMATAAVLATGGSASTLPTSWAETDTGNIGSVVGEGVSPLYPGARYVDIRLNNTTGSAQTVTLQLDSSSITGVSQGDDVTVSAWVSLVSGTITGNTRFAFNERDSGDSPVTNLFGVSFSSSITSELKRFSRTFAVAGATTDRYRPLFQFSDVTNGSDFTIRITLPNSVQQSFLSSVILGQETRTSQAGALSFDLANLLVTNSALRMDIETVLSETESSGANETAWLSTEDGNGFIRKTNSAGGNRIRFGSGASGALDQDWSWNANEVQRLLAQWSNAANAAEFAIYSPSRDATVTDTYDSDLVGNLSTRIKVMQSFVDPYRIHGLWLIPNGYNSGQSVTSDSERYAQ